MGKNRNIRVRGVRREEPDLRQLGRALLALVEAQREAEAEAAHHHAAQEKAQTAPPPPRHANSKTTPKDGRGGSS